MEKGQCLESVIAASIWLGEGAMICAERIWHPRPITRHVVPTEVDLGHLLAVVANDAEAVAPVRCTNEGAEPEGSE